jgi:hypothetical protein
VSLVFSCLLGSCPRCHPRRCVVPFDLELLLIYHIPGGPKAAFGSAVACGILLGVFEGVGVLLGRVFSEGTRPQLPPREFFPLLVRDFTHTSIPFSTRIYGSSSLIVCCYLVLVTYSHPHNPPPLHCPLRCNCMFWNIGTRAPTLQVTYVRPMSPPPLCT